MAVSTCLVPARFPESLEGALENLRQALSADAAELFMRDSVRGDLWLTAFAGRGAEAFCEHPHFLAGQGFPGLVVAQRLAITSQHLSRDERFLRGPVKAMGISSCVCVPVWDGESVVGSLQLAWRKVPVPLAMAVRVLSRVAIPIGHAILAARECLRRRFEEKLLVPGLRTQELFAALIGVLRDHSRADSVAVVHRGDAVSWEIPGGCPARKDRQVVLCNGEPRDLPRACLSCGLRSRCSICLPWQARLAPAATLHVRYTRPPVPPTRYLPGVLDLLRTASLVLECSQPAEPRPAPYSPADLRIRCLGRLEIWLEGRRVWVDSFARRKAVDLLKILLLRGGTAASRDELCELLWPGVELSAGTNRLHGVAHCLREVLEPGSRRGPWRFVRASRDGFFIGLGTDLWVDLYAFQKHMRLAQADAAHPAARLAHLEAACALYRGDLFAEDPYAEWCWADREHLRERYLEALKTAARLCLGLGRSARSVEYFRQALRLDPLREDIHQGLMLTLWEQGRRTDALQQYVQCARIIRQELDTEPLPETRSLYERIRRELIESSDLPNPPATFL
ncbi:MAG: GAF domain-containing protein [Armatimonadetes bacterium]|nr:GAF domain-containing protein [Armatimonadota bacterium]